MTGLNLYDCVQGTQVMVGLDGTWTPMVVGPASVHYSTEGRPYLSVMVLPTETGQAARAYYRRPDELRFPEETSDIPLVVSGRLTPKVFAAARKGGAS